MQRKRQRLEKAHRAKKRSDVNLHRLRVIQYTALQLLRAIKQSDVDDISVVHTLANIELDDEQFVDIEELALIRLKRIVKALRIVQLQHAVSPKSMQSALTSEQLAAYIESFNFSLSPAEDEQNAMPSVLRDYAEKIKLGDTNTGLAAMQRGRNAQKRDANGYTSAGRYSHKAESMYESGIALLDTVLDSDVSRNPNYNAATACDVARWLDRDVSCAPGEQPALDIREVPRIRGSSSKYCLIALERMWGARLKRYWRQREALVCAALLLLYGVGLGIASPSIGGKLQKMRKMMGNIRSEKD